MRRRNILLFCFWISRLIGAISFSEYSESHHGPHSGYSFCLGLHQVRWLFLLLFARVDHWLVTFDLSRIKPKNRFILSDKIRWRVTVWSVFLLVFIFVVNWFGGGSEKCIRIIIKALALHTDSSNLYQFCGR